MRAYFITFRTYGTRLHGHRKGSVDSDHSTPDTPLLAPNTMGEAWERNAMAAPEMIFDSPMRAIADGTIREVCAHRGWILYALHVRTTHVHAVVAAKHPPERVMNDFKAWTTRRLVEAGLVGHGSRVWSRHGSTKWLNSENSLRRACEYTANEQGRSSGES